REWQLEGDAKDGDEDQDEVDVLVGEGQVLELGTANTRQEPQSDGQREEGKADAHRKEHDGRTDKAHREAALVAMQAGSNERPDLPDDDRAAQDEPGKDSNLEEEQESVDRSRVDQPLVADHLVDGAQQNAQHRLGDGQPDHGRDPPGNQRDDQDAPEFLEVLDDGHPSLVVPWNDGWLRSEERRVGTEARYESRARHTPIRQCE